MNRLSEFLDVLVYIFLCFFAIIGFNTVFHHEKYPNKTQIKENGIYRDVIVYNNELYFKKGE